MDKIIRLGLFGASKILENTMSDAFINHPNFVISGLASKSLDRLNIISRKLKCPKHNTYDTLMDCNKIDAAYISLPNSMHYEITKKLLNIGIHCLVEKPLACSENEYTELNEIAKKNNLALLETFQFQYHSQFEYIKGTIMNKRLGELRSIEIKFGFPLFKDKDNIRYKKELKGGAFFDAGVYISKTACLLMNTSKAEVLSKIYYLNNFDVDMYGSCIITNNRDSSVLGSWGFDNSYLCSLDIWFSKGKLKANRIFTAKKDFPATIEITNGKKKLIKEFIDYQYYNNINEFFLTIKSPEKMNEHYFANLIQAKLMKKIYAIQKF